MSICTDMNRYKWSFTQSVRVNFWWALEHLPYRGGEGGLCGPIARYAYMKRKAAERDAYFQRTGHRP
jgi:hypothetical protein